MKMAEESQYQPQADPTSMDTQVVIFISGRVVVTFLFCIICGSVSIKKGFRNVLLKILGGGA